MRLQILIQRHRLPSVTIIHTTGTGPSSSTKSRSATISDLLSDVNDLVPLESADGEWGLEDYVVEVAATGDQDLTYECLHFQTIQSVLREDDEVVVRALSNEDLRVRRLGGRHQITGDGRHLIDGIPFGKQWLRKTTRPGILIPPRKKRRLLLDDESNLESEETPEQILAAGAKDQPAGALIPFTGEEDSEDEEDDADYEEEEDDEDDEGNTDAAIEVNTKQIILSESFEDADTDSEDEPAQPNGLPSDIEQLLADAAEIEHASNLAIASHVLENQLKRKRPIEDEGDREDDEDTFEGFSTAIDGSSLPTNGILGHTNNGVSDSDSEEEEDVADSMVEELAAEQEEKRAKNIVEDDDDDSDDPDATSSSDNSSSDSDADSLMDEIAIKQAKQRALNLIHSSQDGLDEDDTSSSGSDDDDDDNEVSDTGSSSGSESDSDDTSDSDSATTSDSESGSETESARKKAKSVNKSQASPGQSNNKLPMTISKDELSKSASGVPYEGTKRTHLNNDRVKRRKRLDSLKQQGLLPIEADFKALARYEERLAQKDEQKSLHQFDPDEETTATIDEGPTKANDAVEARNELDTTELDKENREPEGAVVQPSAIESVPPVPEIPETSQLDPQSIMEPSPKRARLDVASSRRLILGSLGVRTPKTPEQEQKLRDKFSQKIQAVNQRKEQTLPLTEGSHPLTQQNDAWNERLIISAVECEEPGGVLPPPPFPFQQGWAKLNKDKRKLRNQNQYYQEKHGVSRGSYEQARDVDILNYDDVAVEADVTDQSQAATGKADNASVTDIEHLPSLTETDIRQGATIAYQELHVDASTNYQPAVSPYRIGEVINVHADGTLDLQLAKGSFGSAANKVVDDASGKMVYGKFELADDEAQEDDGYREISFSSMIKAKLVTPSSIQVPNSSHIAAITGGEGSSSFVDDDTAMVPESAEQHLISQATTKAENTVEVDTPCKHEINGLIKEAGFESALDEQLLQPITNPISEGDAENDETADRSQGSYAHRFGRRSPRVIITSSEQQPSSIGEDELKFDDELSVIETADVPTTPATSSPYMPTITTVEYPHISQMNIDSSIPAPTANSSSHQDAQKLSPVPALDLSFTASENEASTQRKAPESLGQTGNTNDNGTRESPSNHLHSEQSVHDRTDPLSGEDEPEIQQTQLPQVHSDNSSSPIPLPDNEGTCQQQSSFLDGPGYDGNDSSYHDSGLDNDSDLPSLSDLMQSQRSSRRTSARVAKIERSSPPPPARKSLRISHVSRKTTKSPSFLSSPELPPSSQPEFKQSQSQQEPRLSQIPAANLVVDLTFSSDPLSPVKNLIKRGNDDDDSDYVGGGSRTKGEARTTSRRSAGRVSNQASQDSGIGKRTFLTRKRDSDPKYY